MSNDLLLTVKSTSLYPYFLAMKPAGGITYKI